MKKTILIITSIITILTIFVIPSFAYTITEDGVEPSSYTYTIYKQDLTIDGIVYPGRSFYEFTATTNSGRSNLLMMISVYAPTKNTETDSPNWTMAYTNLQNYTIPITYQATVPDVTTTNGDRLHAFDLTVTPNENEANQSFLVRIDNIANNNIVADNDYIYIKTSFYPNPQGYNDAITYLLNQYKTTITDKEEFISVLETQLNGALDRAQALEAENETLISSIGAYEEQLSRLYQNLEQNNSLRSIMSGLIDGVSTFFNAIGGWSVGGVSLATILGVGVAISVLFLIIKLTRA